MGKLDGRVALVTGGASGIGRAIAELFVAEGAKAGIIDPDRTEAAAREIGDDERAASAAADVADDAAVKVAIASIVERLGEIDILVNNAGIDTTHELDGMATGMWDHMIAVHLRGTFLCTREVLPAMKRRKRGRIINLLSQLAHKGAPTMVHYCARRLASWASPARLPTR